MSRASAWRRASSRCSVRLRGSCLLALRLAGGRNLRGSDVRVVGETVFLLTYDLSQVKLFAFDEAAREVRLRT